MVKNSVSFMYDFNLILAGDVSVLRPYQQARQREYVENAGGNRNRRA
jgi:hypothetical protein